MTDRTPGDDDRVPPDPPGEPGTGRPVMMSLSDIVELTGEMEHLNELISLTLEQEGGFTTHEAYFAVVHPILDLLEVEIRIRCRNGMSRDTMKLVIQDWIDGEIREIRSGDR